MPTVNPNSPNWYRFDTGLPRNVSIGSDGIYTIRSPSQTVYGTQNVTYTGSSTTFALSLTLVSGTIPRFYTVSVGAYDENYDDLGSIGIAAYAYEDTITMTCRVVPSYFTLSMNSGLSNSCELKVMLNEGLTKQDWVSIYEAGTAEYQKQYFYQNENGTWPSTPTITQTLEGEIGDDVSFDMGTDTEPAQTPSYRLSRYVSDAYNSNQIFDAVVKSDGSTVLRMYFKAQVVPCIKLWQRAAGEEGYTGPTTYDLNGDDLSLDESIWVDIGSQLGFGEVIEAGVGHQDGLRDFLHDQGLIEAETQLASGSTETLTPYATAGSDNAFKAYVEPEQMAWSVWYYYEAGGQYPQEPTFQSQTRDGDFGATIAATEDDRTPKQSGYELDEASSTLTATLQQNGAHLSVKFKQVFTVTYHDPSGTNEDASHTGLHYGDAYPSAPSFTRPGYVLTGWIPMPGTTVTSSITHEAQWEVASAGYTVDYIYMVGGSYDAGIEHNAQRTGTIGDTVSVTPEDKVPTLEGYAYDEGADNVESGVVTADGSLTLKLYFTEVFDITYADGANGQVFPSQTYEVAYGEPVPAFDGTPTRTGYTFTGWLPPVEDFPTATADRTFEAQWQIRQCSYQVRYWYQVTGSYDEGTAILETSETRTANYGSTVQATTEDKTPTKAGYVLDPAHPVNGVTLTDPDGMAYVDVHFKQSLTVTYTDGAGGSVFEDEVHSGLDYGSYTPTYDGTPQRPDYNFVGWSPTVAQTVTEDATYTAQWEAIVDMYSYRVEYYYQSGGTYPSTASSYDTRTAPETQDTVSVTDSDKVPTRPGYVYDTAAANVESAALQETGTVLKLYFKEQFTVTYADGVSGTVFQSQTTSGLDYGATTPFFSGTPERYGYTFTGWTPSVAPTVTKSATYTATWSRDTATYTVERYLQSEGQYGKPTSTDTRSAYVGDTVSLTGSDKTPPQGYAYDDSAQNVESAVLAYTGTVLRAHFVQLFSVTYTDGAGGEAFEDQTTNALIWGQRTPQFSGTPERDGYDFLGWVPKVSSTVQGTVTYTAVWREQPKPILTIGAHSLSEFGQCLASRNTGAPAKKASTVTVPHMSGFWDFSKVTGELSYESREVTYEIELLEDERADLQDRKSELMAWLLQTHDEAIHDDDIPGWHFVGSFSSCEWDEGAEGVTGTITATFLCQPFLYADEGEEETLQVGTQTVSNPGMGTELYAQATTGTATVTIGGMAQSVTTTKTRLVARLLPGDNPVKVDGNPVKLSWHETRI